MKNKKKNIKIHKTAIVESKKIGQGCFIWAFCHIMKDVSIGRNCSIGNNSFLENGCSIGNNVTIKNNCLIWTGVKVGDDAFIGPNVIFTNDAFPRSPRAVWAQGKYKNKKWLKNTVVGRGASIGAGAIILPGVILGEFCMIAAGSIVTKSVLPYSLVAGNPAKFKKIIKKIK